MRRNFILYFLVSFLFFSGACKKEQVEGRFDYQTLGSSANDLLSSSRYPSLQIEIQYMPGYATDTSTLNKLTAFLNSRTNKPGGISIIQEEVMASGLSVYSLNNIVSLERANRRLFTRNNVISVHVLITNGYYSNNDVLAISYWNTSFCIFGKSLDDNTGQANEVSRSILLTTLLEHEFGHLMGLVDQGSPMQTDHRDATNGAHCSNPDCLMYYNVEAGFTDALSAVPAFDANCIADLRANGGK
ncbi:MAG TPA: hypothetical protein VFE54_13515 [Mucilaginibacter sp.]|nr:hypothetical protein [Mucilaginibacter sp.]